MLLLSNPRASLFDDEVSIQRDLELNLHGKARRHGFCGGFEVRAQMSGMFRGRLSRWLTLTDGIVIGICHRQQQNNRTAEFKNWHGEFGKPRIGQERNAKVSGDAESLRHDIAPSDGVVD